MEKLNLAIEGYKCFGKKHEFGLKALTLLTGANSSGKSSVIQSMLFAKIVSETLTEDPDSDVVPLSLYNDRYAMELGTYNDIINRNTETGDIEFSVFDAIYRVDGEEYEENTSSILFHITPRHKALLRKLFSRGFTYLCADRMPPHYEYDKTLYRDICDCHGRNVGDILAKHQDETAISSRSLNLCGKIMLTTQLDEWCDYVFPGVSVRVKDVRENSYQIKERKDAATNVGFGITYALPIFVSGLTVAEGGMLIVENPEAHLHARAQSNMGYFLARMAAAGVRVIIETHSEHIVNGIRRMIVEGKTDMSHDDMTIYFFRNIDGGKDVMEITMDEWGNLSAFPKDFFDQVRQDMSFMMQAERKKRGF